MGKIKSLKPGKQIVIAGIEAMHVSRLLQTTIGLLDTALYGASSPAMPRRLAWRQEPCGRRWLLDLREAGATRIVTSEMVVFEWLEKAGTPEFRELSQVVAMTDKPKACSGAWSARRTPYGLRRRRVLPISRISSSLTLRGTTRWTASRRESSTA